MINNSTPKNMVFNKQKFYPFLKDDILKFVEKNYVGDISFNTNTEKRIKNLFNFKTTKLVNSATNGMFILFNLIKKLKKKNKLVVMGPSYTHPAWINVSLLHNCDIVLVDVNKDTYLIDDKKTIELINIYEPDIIVIVDMFGNLDDSFIQLKELCESKNIYIIEDSANAMFQKKKLFSGCYGHFSVFSFSTPKIITSGEGGCINSYYYDYNNILDSLIYQSGWHKNNCINKEYFGINCYMSPFLAYIIEKQIEKIDEIIKYRKDRYSFFLQTIKKIPDCKENICNTNDIPPSLFTFKVENSNLLNILTNKDDIYYKPYKNMSKYISFININDDFSNSEICETRTLFFRIYN